MMMMHKRMMMKKMMMMKRMMTMKRMSLTRTTYSSISTDRGWTKALVLWKKIITHIMIMYIIKQKGPDINLNIINR